MEQKPVTQICIMLVDDNDIDIFLLQKVIEISACSNSIIVCNSGKSALEYFDLHKHNITKLPDLIFLDLNMPIMNGFAFLSEFESIPEMIKNKCKIVILSSSSNVIDIEETSRNKYVVDYIAKPLSAEAVNDVINKIEINKPKPLPD